MTKHAALFMMLTVAFLSLNYSARPTQAAPPPPPPYACQDGPNSGFFGVNASCNIECYQYVGGSVSVMSGSLGTLPEVEAENDCGPEIFCAGPGIIIFNVPGCIATGIENKASYSFSDCKGHSSGSLGYVNIFLQCTTQPDCSSSCNGLQSTGRMWNVAQPGFTGSVVHPGDMVCVPLLPSETVAPTHCLTIAATSTTAVTGLAPWAPVAIACVHGTCHDVEWTQG